MPPDRWSSLAVGLLVELAAGTVYGFGSYSEKIKLVLGNDQSAVNLVSSVGQVGLYVTIFGGMFYDRFGGAATALIGGSLAAGGYALIYVATLGIGLPATTTSLCIFYFVAWHGSGYMDTSSVCTYCKNFPANKGTIIGLNKSFFGLSGSIVAQISIGLFAKDSAAGVPLLAFLAGLVAAITILCPFFLRLEDERARQRPLSAFDWRRVHLGYALIIALSVYLAVIGVMRTHVSFSNAASVGTTVAAGLLIVLLAALLAFSTGWGSRRLLQSGTQSLIEAGAAREGDNGGGPAGADGGGEAGGGAGAEHAADAVVKPRPAPSLHEDCTALQALATPELYLLWLAMFAGTGPGLMLLSNVAQIAIARAGAYTSSAQTACHDASYFHTLSSTFTVVCGVGNCIGRVLGGYISDAVHTPSRPAWFGLFLLLMAISQLVMALVGGVATLYATLSLCFLAYGAFWSLMPVLVAELFGERAIGTIYTIIGLAPASASFAVTVGVASTVYQAHVPPHAPPLCKDTVGMQDGKCFGLLCYQDTFLITTGLCIFGSALSGVLAVRMRSFYRRNRLAAMSPPLQ